MQEADLACLLLILYTSFSWANNRDKINNSSSSRNNKSKTNLYHLHHLRLFKLQQLKLFKFYHFKLFKLLLQPLHPHPHLLLLHLEG